MDPELIAEARRRGIKIPGESVAPQVKQSVDPELIAEAKRRGIIPAQSEQSRSIEDIGVQASGAMPIMNLLPENIRRAGVKGLMQTPLGPGASFGEKAASAVGQYAPPIAASMLTANPFTAGAIRGVPAAPMFAKTLMQKAARLGTQSLMSGVGAGGAKLAQEATSVGAGEQTPLGAAGEAGMTGLSFASGEALMGGVSAGIQKEAPLIAQGVRAASGTKEAATLGAILNPEGFINAQSVDDMGEAYKAFERYTGLRGIGSQEVEREAVFSVGELFKIATSTMKKVLRKENVDAQTLYSASQAAQKLKNMARFGEPTAASLVEGGIVSQAKSVADDAIQTILPEYKNLRQGYGAAKGKASLSSWLPQNKNLSPNVLRTTGAAFALAEGVRSGNPVAMMAAPFISPRTYGTAIKYGYLGAPSIKAAAQVGAQAGASSLAEHYARVREKR